ncbi:MAG: NADH:ubiquinone reductase (Na(+)-transporting) subunit F [Chlamydiae bacterium CG10_big_fil_rev_8_21_14_0_10_35_9]|nr:MAG: NADH:ubiquinone reductase (Na(+)-transporting) subunit F [Chlamydiae bacterium CG10_big_fil_rev_8_21_14_0_10_35_9]
MVVLYFLFISLKLSFFAIIAFAFIGVVLSGMILLTRNKLVGNKPCQIIINEDPDLTKITKVGSTLLEGLLSHGIAIPSPCGGKATCKQCKVVVKEGGGEPLETEKSTFTPHEIKEGWRLSCQCKIKGDIKVHIPGELLEVKELIGTVKSNENVASFIKELVVEVPVEETIDYKSGGYLQFHVPSYKTNTNDWKETIDPIYYPEWEKYGLFGVTIDNSKPIESVIRAYSMASYPDEKNVLKFTVRIATPPIIKGKVANKPWGICSSYIFSLKPNDQVKLSGPYGESFMIDDNRELVFLIGGAGASFGRSHIMHLFLTENTKRKVTLWYGARSLKENIYENEFEDLAKKYDNFTYHLVLSEPSKEDHDKGWPTKDEDPTKTNFVFKAFELAQLKNIEEPDEVLYYVCGPPMHNASVMKLLDDYGVPRENIVLDDFGS